MYLNKEEEFYIIKLHIFQTCDKIPAPSTEMICKFAPNRPQCGRKQPVNQQYHFLKFQQFYLNKLK